jgi:uncharacterized protein
MKYLVLIGVLLVVYLLWSSKRRAQKEESSAPPARPALPQDMVRCPVCSVHLPRADALPGGNGLLYCSAEHRTRAGD